VSLWKPALLSGYVNVITGYVVRNGAATAWAYFSGGLIFELERSSGYQIEAYSRGKFSI